MRAASFCGHAQVDAQRFAFSHTGRQKAVQGLLREQRAAQSSRSVGLHARQNVRVPLEREADTGVTQPLTETLSGTPALSISVAAVWRRS
jgi:hypothetical protein